MKLHTTSRPVFYNCGSSVPRTCTESITFIRYPVQLLWTDSNAQWYDPVLQGLLLAGTAFTCHFVQSDGPATGSLSKSQHSTFASKAWHSLKHEGKPVNDIQTLLGISIKIFNVGHNTRALSIDS